MKFLAMVSVASIANLRSLFYPQIWLRIYTFSKFSVCASMFHNFFVIQVKADLIAGQPLHLGNVRHLEIVSSPPCIRHIL
jgi:hypothetical protein